MLMHPASTVRRSSSLRTSGCKMPRTDVFFGAASNTRQPAGTFFFVGAPPAAHIHRVHVPRKCAFPRLRAFPACARFPRAHGSACACGRKQGGGACRPPPAHQAAERAACLLPPPKLPVPLAHACAHTHMLWGGGVG
eukprot:354603-Chlamydomonas_euryale.AAC.12